MAPDAFSSSPTIEPQLPASSEWRDSQAGGRRSGLIEIGWIVCDNLDDVDRQAIAAARDRFVALLEERLPEYTWHIVLEQREAPIEADGREAAEYLQWARTQRDIRHWDYVFMFVRPDLRARSRPHAWAFISRSLDSAVVSTARIDPRADDPQSDAAARTVLLGQRIETLALRCLGHLLGLSEKDGPGNVMSNFSNLKELDEGRRLTDGQIGQFREQLPRIADLRLEEEIPERPSWARFYLLSAWRNRYEIVEGVRQARPWQMPLRLARLTIAALTTVLILAMTAEAWELGLRQSWGTITGLSLVALVATIAYVLLRQGLLLRRRHVGLSEQIVATNLTTVAIIATGIVTTYACLLIITLLFCMALFDQAVVSSWAPTLEGPVRLSHYLLFAGFVSATGIMIGALGASFEGENYFRHITFVDEEV